MARGDDIQERLINFAVTIINLCSTLNRTFVQKHVSGQLLRSGTSPAPNYGEARGAESNNDFIHKLKIVLKELNESEIWLKIVIKCEILSEKKVGPILQECIELTRIIGASIKTAVRNRG